MAERTTAAPADAARGPDEAERALGRAFAVGMPVATVVAAIAVGFAFGVAPALLVVAAGTLLGVIGLIWASLRTLSGDAPLAEGFITMGAAPTATGVDSAAERKRRVLRALKDLEHEHEVGKIDDADYARIGARYRAQAKAILREMDTEIEPLRARAEEIARAHLAKKGLVEGGAKATARDTTEATDATETAGATGGARAPARIACPKCSTSNEPDAAFCKKCGTSLATAEASDASA